MRGDGPSNGSKRRLLPVRRPTATRDRRVSPRLVGGLLLLVLIPLVPFLAVVWMISRTLRGVRDRVSWE